MTEGSGDGLSRRQGDVESDRDGAETGRAQEQDAEAVAPPVPASAAADADSAGSGADAGLTAEPSTDRKAEEASVGAGGADEQDPEPRRQAESRPGPAPGATALERELERAPTVHERAQEPEAARDPEPQREATSSVEPESAEVVEPEPDREPDAEPQPAATSHVEPEAADAVQPQPDAEAAGVVEPEPDRAPQPEAGEAVEPEPDIEPDPESTPKPDAQAEPKRQPEQAADEESVSLFEPRVPPTGAVPAVPGPHPEPDPAPSLFESPAPPRAVPPPLPIEERPAPEQTQVVDLTTIEPPDSAEPREEASAGDNDDSTVVVITDGTVREPDESEWDSPPPLPAPASIPTYTPPFYGPPPAAGTSYTPGTGLPSASKVDMPEDETDADPSEPPGSGGVPLLEEIPGGWQAVRRRHRRQTATFLVALLGVLGLGTLAGLMYTGRVAWPFGGRVNVSAQVCTPSKPLPPKQIHVRVYNGSSRAGLAKSVGAQLKALGFVVQETGNDPLEAKVTTAVEIRYGDEGELAGKTATAYFPGKIRQRLDDRTNEVVDVVLGPKFTRVHTRQEANRVLTALRPKLPLSCPPGVTPPTPTPSPSATSSKKARPTPTPTPKR